MANYSNLKTAIENAVDWNNGDNEITGQNLLDILETIIDSLGAKYKFADVATPSSSISTPDEPLFYLAGAGTYANFSGLTVNVQRGTLAIFYYDTAWHWTSVRTDSDAFFNVNQYLEAPSTTYTKANARNAVPAALRSKGMIITYLTTNGWLIEQNLSTSGTWNADANWQTIGPVSVSQNTLYIGGIPSGEVGIFESSLIGANNNFVNKTFSTIEGHKYQVSMIDTQWLHSSASGVVFRIAGFKDNSIIDTVISKINTPIDNNYIFTAKDCDYYQIGIRADLNTLVKFYINDITLESELNEEVSPNLNTVDMWEQGSLSTAEGTPTSSSYRIRTKGYVSQVLEHIKVMDGYKVFIYAYYNDNYVGIYNGSGFEQASFALANNIDFGAIRRNYPNYRYKLVMFISSSVAITPVDWDNIKLYSYLYNEFRKININRPILTFIDDDGLPEQFENWERIHNECGIIPSMALITSRLTQADWSTIERLNNLGFDFISHSHNHQALDELTEQELIADFEATIVALQAHKCDSQLLVYPYNRFNAQSLAVIKKYFRAGFKGAEQTNFLPLKKYEIKRYSFVSATNTTVVTHDEVDYVVSLPKTNAEYDAILDAGALNNGWVVFMSHFRNSYTDGYIFTDEFIESIKHICEYALSKGYKIMTAHDAYLTLRNQFESDTKVVDCNNIFHNL